jgi:hypothetical protein
MQKFSTLFLILLTGCSNYDPMAGTPPPPKQTASPEWTAFQQCLATKTRAECEKTPTETASKP